MDINLVANRWKNYKKVKDPINQKVSQVQASPNKRKPSAIKRMVSTQSIIRTVTGSKGNWKKVFALTKFLSLEKSQSELEPANLVIGARYYRSYIGILMRRHNK